MAQSSKRKKRETENRVSVLWWPVVPDDPATRLDRSEED